MSNPFEVLGLHGSADADEIRAAYRALVKKCHPDQFLDAEEQRAAQEKLLALNLAYEEALKLAAPKRSSTYTHTLPSADAKHLAQKMLGRRTRRVRCVSCCGGEPGRRVVLHSGQYIDGDGAIRVCAQQLSRSGEARSGEQRLSPRRFGRGPSDEAKQHPSRPLKKILSHQKVARGSPRAILIFGETPGEGLLCEKPLPRAPSRRGGMGEGERLGGEAASLREAPLPPDPSLPKSGSRLRGMFLLGWFRLRGGRSSMELRESTAADRAAADVRGGERHIESRQWPLAIGGFLMHTIEYRNTFVPLRWQVAAALSAAVTITPNQENAPNSHGRTSWKEKTSLFPATLRREREGGAS